MSFLFGVSFGSWEFEPLTSPLQPCVSLTLFSPSMTPMTKWRFQSLRGISWGLSLSRGVPDIRRDKLQLRFWNLISSPLGTRELSNGCTVATLIETETDQSELMTYGNSSFLISTDQPDLQGFGYVWRFKLCVGNLVTWCPRPETSTRYQFLLKMQLSPQVFFFFFFRYRYASHWIPLAEYAKMVEILDCSKVAAVLM